VRGEFPLDPHDFAAYFSFAPAALALRECVRLRAVRRLDLPAPILDVGCGDGLFARLAYPDKQAWGIDINPSEVQRAQATSSYSTLICGNICRVDLPAGFFGSAIANCSLEHVPDISGALANIRGALRFGAPFALIVPTPDWTRRLAFVEALHSVGLTKAARAYGDALDRVFSHVHLYDAAEWQRRLEQAGFDQVQVTPIVSRATSWAFDLLLYPSLLGYFTKKLTGRWVLCPFARALEVDVARALTDAIGKLAPAGDDPGEYLIVCRAGATRG
jgi:SAM-dependent methyltransferase